MIYLYCSYKSEGVVDLRDTIRSMGHDCLRINSNHGQKFQHGPLFNWGCGHENAPNINQIVSGKYFNRPSAVRTSCSKVATYQKLLASEVWTVAMTQRRNRALEWQNEGRTVLAREDEGSNGNGIVVVKPGEPLPNANFYSKFFPSTHEFRLHVAFGKIIDIAMKVKRDSETWEAQNKPHDQYVRSFKGGWRLSHQFDVPNLPDIAKVMHEVEQCALSAIKAVGLDFGAVDMLANLDPDWKSQRFLVCETNSAPAMELEPTLKAYARAFIAQAKAA